MKQEIFEKKEQLSLEYANMRDWMNRTSCTEIPAWKDIAEKVMFFHVKGIVSDSGDAKSFEALYSALLSLQIGFCVAFKIADGKLDAYFGSSLEQIVVLKGLLNRVVGFSLSDEMYEEQEVLDNKYSYESVLVGDGIYPENAEKNLTDVLLSYKFQEELCVVFSVTPLSRKYVNDLSDFFGVNLSKLQELTSRQITDRDDRETISYAEENGDLKCFLEVCEKNAKKFSKQSGAGVFFDTIKVFSNSKTVIDIATGIYVSQADVGEYPEVLRAISIDSVTTNTAVATNMQSLSINGFSINLPMYSNIHTEEEVAYFLSFPREDTLGLFHRVIPHFDIEREYTSGLCLGDIKKNGESISSYYIPLSELNRNVLISGLVGSGKTNSVEHLLINMYKEKIPFSVLDSAKSEYWELKSVIPDLKIISLGDVENGFYINPFEPANDSIPLQTHLDAVYAAFCACFEWVSPMEQILERLFYRVYKDNGFDIAKNIRNGNHWPTIEQCYWTLRDVVEEQHFDSRMESDLIACISQRLNSMRVGSKGMICNCRRSTPMSKVFESNCIIEMENIGDEEVKSLIMGLFLVNLKEHCMQRETSHLSTQHCTVIEEAHTLLRKTNGSTGRAQEKGVNEFSKLLRTLRSKGECFCIIDQSPVSLCDDVLINSNLKVAHRTVSYDDKTILGKTMNCDEEQQRFMTVLERGEAIVFSEGDYQPKLVQVEYVNLPKNEGREEVLKKSRMYVRNQPNLYEMSPFCLYCDSCFMENRHDETELRKKLLITDYKDWQERIDEIDSLQEFKEILQDLGSELIRQGYFDRLNCILNFLLREKEIGFQHDLYQITLKIMKSLQED